MLCADCMGSGILSSCSVAAALQEKKVKRNIYANIGIHTVGGGGGMGDFPPPPPFRNPPPPPF